MVTSLAGHFTKPVTTTGVQSIVSGLAWQPRVGLIWTEGGDTLNTLDSTIRNSFGAVARDSADVQTQRNVCGVSDNGEAATDSWRDQSETVAVILLNSAGTKTVIGDATITADGLEIDWTTNDADPVIFHYLLLGGDTSFRDARWVSYTEPAVTGSQAYTGAGFTPNLAMVLGGGTGGTANRTRDIGFATASAQCCLYHQNFEGGLSFKIRALYNDRVLQQSNNNGGVSQKRVAFTSMDADGCTVNWIDRSGTIRVHILYMDLDDPFVGGFTKAASATPTNNVTAPGFNPAAVLYLAHCGTAFNSLITHDEAVIGVSTNDNVEASLMVEVNSANPTVAVMREHDNAVPYGASSPSSGSISNSFIPTHDSSGFDAVWQGSSANGYVTSYICFGEYEPSASSARSSFIFVG